MRVWIFARAFQFNPTAELVASCLLTTINLRSIISAVTVNQSQNPALLASSSRGCVGWGGATGDVDVEGACGKFVCV